MFQSQKLINLLSISENLPRGGAITKLVVYPAATKAPEQTPLDPLGVDGDRPGYPQSTPISRRLLHQLNITGRSPIPTRPLNTEQTSGRAEPSVRLLGFVPRSEAQPAAPARLDRCQKISLVPQADLPPGDIWTQSNSKLPAVPETPV
ncbi:hypothetical protein Ddc_00516 [Ditylenchus destructor]|nr:hypothetical protein Ddc_00516 [Ditylenchus destructor]